MIDKRTEDRQKAFDFINEISTQMETIGGLRDHPDEAEVLKDKVVSMSSVDLITLYSGMVDLQVGAKLIGNLLEAALHEKIHQNPGELLTMVNSVLEITSRGKNANA